jgi:hypothetical protein
MEVCTGFELITIENAAALGNGLLDIGEGLEAQMIHHMRHDASPRLMALQSIRGADLRESYAPPSAGNPIEGLCH